MTIPKVPGAPGPRSRVAKPPAIPESEVQAGMYTFEIIDWVPTPLNRLLASHWAAAGRMKKHDRLIIAMCSLAAGIPDAAGKRRVSLRITLPKGVRSRDPDSHWKSLLDGLVHAKLLKNDSDVWCEMGTMEHVRGKRLSTTIILEDIL